MDGGYDAKTYYGGGRSKNSVKNKANKGPSPDRIRKPSTTGCEGLIEENRLLRQEISKLKKKIEKLEN